MTPDKMATAYLERYWDGYLPINPFYIAERDGVRIGNIDQNQYPDLSGVYLPNLDGESWIYINHTENNERQRFTCAHELGHRAMGHYGAQLDRKSQADIQYPSNPIEAEANAFAASLLMPELVIFDLIKQDRYIETNGLARVFNVSLSAMTYRLKNLGISY